MIVVSVIKIISLIILCVNSSVSDTKNGVIKNYSIVIAVISGFILNAIEWIFISSEHILIQISNISIVFILSILLYASCLWAAGDCKLMFAIALLIPYDFYLTIINKWFSLILILVFSFVLSYLFLIVDSICVAIKRKHIISTKKIMSLSILFLKRYIACISYIAFANQLAYLIIPNVFIELRYAFFILNICISFIVSGIKILQNKYLVIIIALAVIIIKISQHQIIASKSMLINYTIVFLMLLLRLFIDEYNYETISTKKVTKGMVLSTATIALFMKSKVKGLPAFTTEDLRSRLTQQEVDSILRWEHSKYGSESIEIVRKIPFAIFISLGTFLFLVFGVLM